MPLDKPDERRCLIQPFDNYMAKYQVGDQPVRGLIFNEIMDYMCNRISDIEVDIDDNIINLKEEGTLLANTPHTTLDFIGTWLTAADVDGTEASITVAATRTNILVVEADGDDSTGTVGRLDLPYLTLAGAEADATSGDTIVVFPGIYTAQTRLGIDGVNYHFMAGAILTKDTTDNVLFDTTGGKNIIISGDGDLRATVVDAAESIILCDGGSITVECNRLEVTKDSYTVIARGSGVCKIHAKKEIINNGKQTGSQEGDILRVNNGFLYVTTPYMSCGGEVTSCDGGGEIYVTCDKVVLTADSGGDGQGSVLAGVGNGTLIMNVKNAIVDSTNSSNAYTFECKTGSTGTIKYTGNITHTGGQPFLVSNSSGHSISIDGDLTISGLIDVNNGTVDIRGKVVSSLSSSEAVNVAAGIFSLNGSISNNAINQTVLVAAAGAKLDISGKIVCGGTNSMTGAGIAFGKAISNKAHNVTGTVGGLDLTVDTSVA